jgi:hypothetical protein
MEFWKCDWDGISKLPPLMQSGNAVFADFPKRDHFFTADFPTPPFLSAHKNCERAWAIGESFRQFFRKSALASIAQSFGNSMCFYNF